MNNTLTVFINKRKAGYFYKDENSHYSFQYDIDYCNDRSTPALSPRLPKTDTVYSDRETKIFFANLVPEGTP